ncbi:MAG: galactokinase [Chitinophagaceae bacterium]|nr:MAG: galactokinase [Chitinophagaceae bacterium]
MPSIQEKFTQFFGHAPSLMVQSPGRINLIGEHTDYNHGFVLPAAIDKYVQIAFEHRTDGMIHMHAIDLNETVIVQVHPLQPHTITWVNYIIGVVAQVQDYLTYAVHNKETLYKLNEGFDICIQGDIPIGAGLSSSAAVESAVIFALNEWYALGLTKMQMALMAQKAEHEFAGVKCGIMDMFASIHGEANQVMLLDCQDLSFKYYPLQLNDYCIVLFDTSIKHALASSEYNTRRLECEQGIKILQQTYPAIQTFRDVSVQQVEECLSLYKDTKENINPSSVTTHQSLISTKVYQRCKYVVEEIERVQLAVKDLLVGDLHAFGQKMFATHRGLSELYEVSCPELDVLVNAVKDNEHVLGARMMGGGFGGCTINIIQSNEVENIIAQVTEQYHHETHKKLHTYQVKIEQGTHII